MKKTVKFGEFEFDCANILLKRKGEPVTTLNFNHLKLLKKLVENSGQMVKKGELGEAAWHGFDIKNDNEAQKLTKAISILRKELGNEGKHIETIQGEGYRFLERLAQKLTPNKDIVSFFGKAIEEKSVRMVFAYRKHEGNPNHMKSGLSDSVDESGNPALFEGVSTWLPSEDIRGCVYIVNALSKQVRIKGVKFYNETDTDNQSTNTTISFGLFSIYTKNLSKLCNNELFQIINAPSPKDDSLYTDNIALDNEILIPKENEDFAIVARIVTHPSPGDVRVQFVVAGRTATGTSVAGWVLADKWEDLSNLYKNEKEVDLEKDSLAVIISHALPEKDKDGQVKDNGGQIDENSGFAKDKNGKMIIKWARHSK
jgi:DNA-binding winged helix-turn-helix (wHTH) protein